MTADTQSASDTDVTRYKDIIKMSDTYTFITGEVYYSQEAVDKQIGAVLDRLVHHFSGLRVEHYNVNVDLEIVLEKLEAERNKLKEDS